MATVWIFTLDGMLNVGMREAKNVIRSDTHKDKNVKKKYETRQ